MLPLVTTLQLVNCDGVTYFSYSKQNCISVAQCLDNDEFPYVLGKVCIKARPDIASGMTRDGHGAYMCPSDKYIINNEARAWCASSVAECSGLYISVERKVCLSGPWACLEYAHYLGYGNVTGKYCVPFNDC